MNPAERADLGTEDMEKDMLPSSVRAFYLVAVLAAAILLIFNSQSLVDWTRQPQAGPGIDLLERPAVAWNDLMMRAGTQEYLLDAKRLAKKLLDP